MEHRKYFFGQPPYRRPTDWRTHRGARRNVDTVCQEIEKNVRYANITIIEGNDASQFGIGIVAARITEMVVRDERAVIQSAVTMTGLASRCHFRVLSDEMAWSELRTGDVTREQRALAFVLHLRKSLDRS